MVDEALDQITNDVAYSGYDEQVVSGIDQVRQNLKIRLLLIMGELFDNTTVGVDYFGAIFGGNGNQNLIDALLKSTIKSTPEVAGILSYSSTVDRAQRSVSVSCRVSTIYGETELSNVELMQ